MSSLRTSLRNSFCIPRRHAGVLIHAAALAAFATVIATPAHAQVGSLIRKAKDKATSEAAKKSGASAVLEGEAVAFDDVILELTDARLTAYLAGVQAGDAAEQQGAGSRATLQERRVALSNQSADLASRHGTEIDKSNERVSEVERCRDDELQALTNAHREKLTKRMMTDAALRDKVIALMQKQGEAVSRNDTTAARRVENELRALAGEGKADSAAVDTKCGPVPARHPAALQIAKLDAEVASIDEELRAAASKSSAAEVEASGMNVRQFAMVRERVTMYLAKAKSNTKQRGFTTNELRALEARRGDLERAG